MRSTQLVCDPTLPARSSAFVWRLGCSRCWMPVHRLPGSVTAWMRDISIETWDHRAVHMFRQQFLDASRDETMSGSCELGSSQRESTVEARRAGRCWRRSAHAGQCIAASFSRGTVCRRIFSSCSSTRPLRVTDTQIECEMLEAQR